MKHVVRISDQLFAEAKRAAEANACSPSEQIEHWARIGHAVLTTPEVPPSEVAARVPMRIKSKSIMELQGMLISPSGENVAIEDMRP